MIKISKFKNNGFVLLYSITLAAILLAIALGVANVAEKEIKFGTSARDTSGAFLAADTGVECAIFHDKSDENVFPVEGHETSVNCGGSVQQIDFTDTITGGIYTFILQGLGEGGAGCAKVSLEKDNVSDPALTKTTITSKGYNKGDAECEQAGVRVERELKVVYYGGNPQPPQAEASGFPIVGSMVESAQTSDTTTHAVTMPAGITEGDLLLVFFAADGNTALTWPAGWNTASNLIFRETQCTTGQTCANTLEARYKVATAADVTTTSISVTSGAAERSAHHSFRIYNYTGTPESRDSEGTVDFAGNPPSLPPTWGSQNTLWLAVMAKASGTTILTNYPTNYTNGERQQGGSGANGVDLYSARRELNAASENPSDFTWTVSSGSDAWIAATVGIQGYTAP